MKSFPLAIAALIHMLIWSAPACAEEKPNILWIVTDDQRWDSISAFNQIRYGTVDSRLGQVLSPNVDRLAAMGTTFINTYNQNPSCQPSRTIMHTGRYSHRTGVYGFENYNPTGMEHWRPMFPEILRDQAGYQTIAVGKLGLYARQFAKGDASSGPRLYDTDLGYRKEFAAKGLVDWIKETKWSGGKRGAKVETFFFPHGEKLLWPMASDASRDDSAAIRERLNLLRAYDRGGSKDTSDGETIGGINPQTSDRTRDANFCGVLIDHLANAGSKYTDKLGRKQEGPDPTKPVFAYCGFEFPHTPVLPPADFREKFAEFQYEIPKFTAEERAGFPPQILRMFEKWETDHFTDAEKQQMVADYYAYCAYGDSLVGKLADEFIDHSEGNNRPWLILYVCGDHGWRLNEHGMASKFLHYDTDLNNPIIAVSSDKERFPAGKVVTDFTQFVDMAPTFLAAAGIDVSEPAYDYLDGRDLAQTAAGKLKALDYIIAEPTWVIGPRAVIRTRDYKFAMRIRPHQGNSITRATAGKDIDWAIHAEWEEIEPTLYDLRHDPGETRNVAMDSHYRPVLNALRQKLQNIVLGDGRVEVAWTKTGSESFHLSNFAPGADDGVLSVPVVTPQQD